MQLDFKPRGVCSKNIHVELDGNTITNVKFTDGCAGNASGISKLVAGMDAHDVIDRLEGVTCGPRKTSCPDQLAHALRQALAQQH
ncbi:MAG: TIGR03905 family TSCPD domain-containing protein [Atopobiaceae bacterium]